MISFPNCKINLGLNVVAKRNDGFHDLETVFYPINVTDIVEVIQESEFKFSSTGLVIDGSSSDNLCVKAYNLLKKDFPGLPNVHVHLHKVIPMGAGLGGGSSNGAFVLKMLNKKCHLQIDDRRLIEYALELGSDCPFFIINKPAFAEGRGERMEVVDLDLSAFSFVLVNPRIHVSTKTAFSELVPGIPSHSIKEIIKLPVTDWKNWLKNDFESTVFAKFPEIDEIKVALYNKGAIYASMTGTGSTVYGLFEKGQVPHLEFPAHYHVIIPDMRDSLLER